MIIIFQTRDDT